MAGRQDSATLNHSIRIRRRHWVYATAAVLQVPILTHLGRWAPGTTALLFAFFLGLGWLMIRVRPRNPEWERLANMTWAMLGPGNLGMVLGWWADAGFGGQGLVDSCCHSHRALGLGAVLAMPGMNLGMLLFGLPPMLLEPSAKQNQRRISLAILSGAGMVWGMALGGEVVAAVAEAVPAPRFLVAFAGMTAGMMLGMFFCCELGRAISLRWRRA